MSGIGYSVPRVVRDFILVNKLGLPYDKAVALSNELDQYLKGAAWLELYDGTTFTKSFTPKKARDEAGLPPLFGFPWEKKLRGRENRW